ncbi:MAG: hypothetical protein WCO52_05265 [bacterium]
MLTRQLQVEGKPAGEVYGNFATFGLGVLVVVAATVSVARSPWVIVVYVVIAAVAYWLYGHRIFSDKDILVCMSEGKGVSFYNLWWSLLNRKHMKPRRSSQDYLRSRLSALQEQGLVYCHPLPRYGTSGGCRCTACEYLITELGREYLLVD